MEVKKIYFDMDGVLADFERGISEICGLVPQKQRGHNEPEDDIMWARVKEAGHFYDRLEIMPGAAEMFTLIHRKYGDRCEVLTGIPKPRRGIVEAGEDKTKWMHRLFDPDVKVNIVFKEEKKFFCTGRDCLLIDDLIDNVRAWEENGGTGILHTSCAGTLAELVRLGILDAQSGRLRNIPLQGAKNVRDLGGIPTEDGGSVRPGRIIRGASLAGITPKDGEKLSGEYRLKKIIDLRTGAESREKPDVVPPGVAHMNIPVFAEAEIGITHEEKNGFVVPGPANMADSYRFMLTDPAALSAISRIMREIFDTPDGSVLFHCSVGKDRTGVIAMLTLGILGVKRGDIASDYLYTNVEGEADARKYYDVAFAATGGDTELSERTRRAFLALEENLNAAFEVVDSAGGFEPFFTDRLGFSTDDINKFRREVLE